MARTPSELPAGPRLTDYISLGVIASAFPRATVDEVLAETGKTSERQRDLPAHVVMYYVIAMTLYMDVSYREVLRCLLLGVEWLLGLGVMEKVAGKSAISQARKRLGSEPVKALHDRIVRPIALRKTLGAWYRKWRLISLDGSTLAVPDTEANEAAFGRPGARIGEAAYPLVRIASLVEGGTHVLFGTVMDAWRVGEIELARRLMKWLGPGMLCLADRNFFGFDLWCEAQATGCDLLWRVKVNTVLPCEHQFRDGSYLSTIYPSAKDRRHNTNGVKVRVVEYQLVDVPDADPIYRVITTILSPRQAPAVDLARLYHERWEIENALDELKTHLRGPHIVLRSKRPELVKQEVYGLMMAHFAIRGLMHEAALSADIDPDTVSFTHTVCVVRRRMSQFVASPPAAEGSPASERAQRDT